MVILFITVLIRLIQSINKKKSLKKFEETAYLFEYAYDDYIHSNIKSYVLNIFATLKCYGLINSKVRFNYDSMYDTDGINALNNYKGVVMEDIDKIIYFKELDNPDENDAINITKLAKDILEKSNYLGQYYFRSWMRSFFRRVIKEEKEPV